MYSKMPTKRKISIFFGFGWPSNTHVPASSTISIIFEIAWPITAKFCVEPPLIGGTKVCLCDLGHMTKMAATSIYGKKSSPESVDQFP